MNTHACDHLLRFAIAFHRTFNRLSWCAMRKVWDLGMRSAVRYSLRENESDQDRIRASTCQGSRVINMLKPSVPFLSNANSPSPLSSLRPSSPSLLLQFRTSCDLCLNTRFSPPYSLHSFLSVCGIHPLPQKEDNLN